jgi:Tfp pilus assembly protein PilF
MGIVRASRLAACVILACLTLVASARAQSADAIDARAAFARAVSLQQQGQLEDAVLAYRSFLIAQPDSLAGHSNLAVVLVRLGRYEDAIAEYERALAIDARQPAIRLNLAIARYKASQFAEAAAELARVRAIEPDNMQATLLEADCRLQLGEDKAVIALLEPIESMHQDDLAIAYLLGMAYLRAGQVDRGQVRIDRILRHGDSAEANVLMGVALREAHDLPGSLKAFAKAVALNPNLPDLHALYGQALYTSGDRARAREEFDAELRADPNDYTANINLAVIAREDQRSDDARRYVERALRVRPADPAARYQSAALKMEAGDLASAQQTLEALTTEHADWIEPHVTLAVVYYRLKRKDDGDRQRAIVEELNRQAQAKEPGAQPDTSTGTSTGTGTGATAPPPPRRPPNNE